MLDDRELIARILGEDAGAADLFVTRFTRFVWAILVRHLRLETEVAEELHQEVFLRLWEDDYRRLRLWSGDGDFAYYLAPIVRNLAMDRLRAHPGTAEVPLEQDDRSCRLLDPDPDPEELARIQEQRRALEAAVLRLTGRDRELYRRRYDLDESYRQIAEAMGLTVNNVGVSLARLTGRLTRVLCPEVRSSDAGSSTS